MGGRAREVDHGDGYFCALLADLTVSCWGLGSPVESADWTGGAIPQLSDVEQLVVSLVAVCGIDGDGRLICVPDPTTSEPGASLLASDIDTAWAMGSDICWMANMRTTCTELSPRTNLLTELTEGTALP